MPEAPGPRPGPPEGAARDRLTGTVMRGVGLAGSGYVLTQVLTLLAYLVLARLATPEDFGEFAAGTILVGIGLLFTESGMLAAVIQRRDRVEEAAATAVVSTFAAGTGFALVALALAPLVGAFFDSETVADVAAVSSGLLLVRTMPVVPNALLQRRFSFLRRLVVEPAGVLVFGAVAIVATANGLGVWGLVIGQYAGASADLALSWGLARWRPRLRSASFEMWRELIGYGRHVFTSAGILRIGRQVPVALIGRFIGEAPLGQYRYAERIASTPFAVVLAGASYVLFPALARISHDRSRLTAAFRRSLRWMAVIAMPGGMILVPLGEPIATVVFGDVWERAGEAAMALSGFAAASAIVSVVSEAFKAAGRPRFLVRLHLLEVAVGAAAMAALLPLGLVGVAAGLSIGAVAGAAYALARVSDVVDLSAAELTREVSAPIVAAFVMVVTVTPLELGLVEAAERGTALGAVLLLGEALLALAIYAATLHLLSRGIAREFVGLLRAARRRPV